MGEIKKEIDYFLYMKRSKENKAKNDLKLKMENIRKNIKKKKEKKIISCGPQPKENNIIHNFHFQSFLKIYYNFVHQL